MLPQLSLTFPSVNAAAAAFGAAYDSALLRNGDSLAYDDSTKQYGLALRLLQLELNRPEPQYAPLLLTSTLLAAAETVQARQKGALAHVLGAFGVFMTRQKETKLLPSSIESSPQSPSGGLSDDIVGMLENLCISIDLQVATFTWGQPPNLPPEPYTDTTFAASNIDELCRELPKLLHASMHFVGEASQEIFKEYADLTFELVLKQSQQISWLRKWLDSFSELVETGEAGTQHLGRTRYRHLRMLKAQCLSTLLAVSNIRTTSQVSWDRFAAEFEEIVHCAEVVLDEAGHYLTSSQSPLQPFCPSPGIIQPLFFTARKYRHSVVRRRAISLLRVAGFEGPFSGDFEADLATRFVEIEEGRPFLMHLRDDQVITPAEIPDWRRICSCWRLSERYDFDERVIKFCRRRRPPSDEGLDSTSPSAKNQADRWEVWEEIIRSFKKRAEVGDAASLPIKVDRHWVPISGEAKFAHQTLHTSRLSRDPDWVKSAVGSGEWWNFYDHPDPLR